MKIIIKDGIDTWELTTGKDTELNREIETHARELIKIAEKLVYGNKNTKSEIKIK